jgi:putative intracellular protease/amidase
MNVIVVLYPACVFFEIAEAISLLSKNSQIIIASPDGKPVRVGEGFTVEATLSYAQVNLSQVRFVLIPGGDCSSVMHSTNLDELLKRACSEADIFIGGICNGALVLANAGLLKGRRCTHTATPKYAPIPEFQELISFATPRFSGSIYIDEDVVIDERIITAKPWAHSLFARRLAEAACDL